MRCRSCAKSKQYQTITLLAFVTTIAAGGLVIITSAPTDVQIAFAQEQQQQMTSDNSTRVAAGGVDAEWDDFVPQNIEINVGDSVTWYNPSPVAEPHTATIMTNDSFIPPLAAPFAVSNTTALQPLMPDANVEPLIVPPPSPTSTPSSPSQQQTTNGSQSSSSSSQNNTITVIIDNARAWNPVVIDSTGNNVTHLPPNANYTMDGTESFVNSGFIFPADMVPPGIPPITEFTVTFESPGSYPYLCALHPWMTGTVVVS
jgi:plastocyanin